jgi:hypothetical protein
MTAYIDQPSLLIIFISINSIISLNHKIIYIDEIAMIRRPPTEDENSIMAIPSDH